MRGGREKGENEQRGGGENGLSKRNGRQTEKRAIKDFFPLRAAVSLALNKNNLHYI